jgi:hypothetical protein
MSVELASHFPAEVLEQRAAEQRRRLHNSVSDLRSSLTDLKSSVEENVRERLDVNRFARRHVWSLAAGASLVALLAGNGVAALFTKR